MPTATCRGAAVVVGEIAVREVTAGAVRDVTPAGRAVAAVAALPAARAGPAAMSAAKAQARTQRRASRGHAVLAGLWSRCVGH
jgi:antitoxin (DNA-binding transcriptional repressor) of toxin-antitoxin stability system